MSAGREISLDEWVGHLHARGLHHRAVREYDEMVAKVSRAIDEAAALAEMREAKEAEIVQLAGESMHNYERALTAEAKLHALREAVDALELPHVPGAPGRLCQLRALRDRLLGPCLKGITWDTYGPKAVCQRVKGHEGECSTDATQEPPR